MRLARGTQELLARPCDPGHLGIFRFWNRDRSEEQRATDRLVGAVERNLGLIRWPLPLPGAASALTTLDGVMWDGLLGSSASGDVS